MLGAELRGVQERKWNSERPLVFIGVALVKTSGVLKAQSVRARITRRLDLWEQGLFVGLVEDTEAEGRLQSGRAPAGKTDAQKDRAFLTQVLAGKIRNAVRSVTGRNQGGVMYPADSCSKTGRPVLEVLQGKHPPLRVPDLADPSVKCFEHYEHLPEVVPSDFTESDVAWVAAKLQGSAGAGGAESVEMRNWLLRFGLGSEELSEELAQWAE